MYINLYVTPTCIYSVCIYMRHNVRLVIGPTRILFVLMLPRCGWKSGHGHCNSTFHPLALHPSRPVYAPTPYLISARSMDSIPGVL